MDIASLAVGVLGLIVSVCGFTIAVWQIRRTRTAAESAEEASVKAREAVSYVSSISDLSQIINQIEQLKELHRNHEWKRAIDRYSSLMRLLAEASARIPEDEKDENLEIFKRAIMQLREMTKEVNTALEQDIEPSSAKFNNILADFEQPLIEKLIDLENYLAVAAGARTNENDRV